MYGLNFILKAIGDSHSNCLQTAVHQFSMYLKCRTEFSLTWQISSVQTLGNTLAFSSLHYFSIRKVWGTGWPKVMACTLWTQGTRLTPGKFSRVKITVARSSRATGKPACLVAGNPLCYPTKVGYVCNSFWVKCQITFIPSPRKQTSWD